MRVKLQQCGKPSMVFLIPESHQNRVANAPYLTHAGKRWRFTGIAGGYVLYEPAPGHAQPLLKEWKQL